ncbi:aldehyde dehydrogenase family protein, partial [Streptomyces shaanxiensis]
MPIATVNPANGETLKTYEAMGEEEIERRLQLAEATFRTYRTTSFAERARLLNRAAELLDEGQQDIARVMTTEMGKPVKQARAEAAKCAKAMRWYAEHAEALLADDEPSQADVEDSGGARARVLYRPLGPVLAVMPWNFPLWQVVRFAAPALMAGNVGLLKHASNVPQTALFLEDLFHQAGYTQGCFQTLLVGSGAIDDILRDERVKAATLTGSEPAGRAVASTAGDMVKKTVLELGGSDPYVVMPSADIDRAAEVAVTARVQNNGQSCIAAKRFIVHTDVYDRFTERFVAGMKALKVGDPLEEDTEVGPLASEQGRTDLEELVDDARRSGANVLCGGERPDGPGWYYPPTVVAEVTREMRIHREETFGPVATLYRAADLDEAVLIANDSPFGLSSNV